MPSLYPHTQFVVKADCQFNFSILLSVFSASSVFHKLPEITVFLLLLFLSREVILFFPPPSPLPKPRNSVEL